MSQHYLITGCSGAGKSTLLDALATRGHAVVPEPGRRIVAAEQAVGGGALPWVDMEAFALKALAVAKADLDAARAQSGPIFFDRGLIDAAVALQDETGAALTQTLGPTRAYAKRAFLAPPWPEIYQRDAQRQHGYKDALAEYARLEAALRILGYEAVILPKSPVATRVAFVLQTVGHAG